MAGFLIPVSENRDRLRSRRGNRQRRVRALTHFFEEQSQIDSLAGFRNRIGRALVTRVGVRRSWNAATVGSAFRLGRDLVLSLENPRLRQLNTQGKIANNHGAWRCRKI